MLRQKDVDLEIMKNLDDRSLLSLCLVNKTYSNLCNNETFWYNRYVERFGVDGVKYKPVDRSWKNNYLQTIIDLDIYSDDPKQFLKHVFWSPKGPEHSEYITLDPTDRTIILKKPFLEAPEWVMNNFYLLDLGPAYINGEVVNHVTPEMLFKYHTRHITPNMQVNGIAYSRTDWWRRE